MTVLAKAIYTEKCLWCPVCGLQHREWPSLQKMPLTQQKVQSSLGAKCPLILSIHPPQSAQQ